MTAMYDGRPGAGEIPGQAGGFEPLHPYRPETPAELQARLIEANERASVLAEQLAAVTSERDAAEHRAADLEDRNRELAAELEAALDWRHEHALDAERETLVAAPIPGHAFAGLIGAAERGGVER